MHALGTRSLALSDKKNDPDDNGGFEMTWTLDTYLSWFEKILGYRLVRSASEPFYTFTKEQSDKLAQAVTPFMLEGNLASVQSAEEKTILEEWHGIGTLPIFPVCNPVYLADGKWYKRLFDIFNSGEAVWYSM